MQNQEYFDLINKLGNNWNVVIEAYPAGLPLGLFSHEFSRSIETLREIEGILDSDLKLCSNFRKTIVDITETTGRSIEQFAAVDFKSIADHFQDWHPL